MSTGYYRKGRTYEIFIKKTFNYKKRKRNGADESLMIQLFLNEQAKASKEPRIPHNRQLFKVKMYIEKAIIKLEKRKKYINSYEQFSPLLAKLEKAKTANDLSKVANAGLSKIIELENEMKRSA